MARFPITAAIAATGAAAVQVPLQNPLMNPSLVQEPIEYEKLPLVDSEVLQDRISSWNLEARSQVLYQVAQLSQEEYNHPTRVIGSKGHNGTLSYITSTLSQLGGYYDVWNQTFPAVTGNVFESRLVIGDELPKTASTFSLTPATKDKEPVHGNVVLVGADGCEAGDYPEELKGNIALIKRGTCPFGTKSELAGKAGAKAAVVYNTEPEELHGTLGTPSPDHVATFGIGSEEAEKYIKQLKDGEHLDAIAYVDAEVNTIMTTNVLAQTKGGDQENCVMLGGHSDSVPEGPGINDDGSGSLSLLELAIQLSSFQVNNCVRFAWWSAEEEGLLGSNYYVSTLEDDENLKIRLFMDYDMMGSPNFAYQIYNATNAENPKGSEELKQLYIDWYESKGLNYTFIPFDGRSDYDGFIRNGIPGGGIATGAEGIKTEDEVEMFGGKAGDWYDPCYHQLCDGTDNVDLTAWEVNTKLIAHSVATYALSFKDFPERTLDAKMEAYAAKTKYRGPKLIL